MSEVKKSKNDKQPENQVEKNATKKEEIKKQEKAKQEETKEEDSVELIEITEELKKQIKDISPSLFLDLLVKENKNSIKNKRQKIMLLEGNLVETPGLVNNRIFTYDRTKRDTSGLTSKDISSLVPFIRLFKVYYTAVPRGKKAVEVEVPFEDHNSKFQMENIFREKTSRGAGVGLTGFSWKSEGKQEANIGQYTATLQLHIQDITELDKIRNSVDGKDVALIDLIYPQIRNKDPKESFKYDKNKTLLKVVVGWKGQNSRADESFGTYSMILNLVRHNFNFNEDGTIDLEIEYIANLEMESLDSTNNNVLFPKKQKAFDKVDKLLRKMQNLKKKKDNNKIKDEKFKEEVGKEAFAVSRMANNIVDEEIKSRLQDAVSKMRGEQGEEEDYYNEKPDEALSNGIEVLKKIPSSAKVSILTEILDNLEKAEKIKYLKLDGEVVQNVAKVLNLTKKSIVGDEEDFNTITENLKSAKANLKKTKSIVKGNMDLAKKVNEAATDAEEEGEKLNFEETLSELDQELIESLSGENEQESIIVPFVSLYDILCEFFKNCDYFSDLSNHLVLGEFTYKDYETYDPESIVYKPVMVEVEGGKKEKKLIKVFKLAERRANFADIPITIPSFINWFNSNVINKNIKKMSANSIINLLMNGLVPINIKQNQAKFLPSYKIRHTTKYATFSAKEEGKIRPKKPVPPEEQDPKTGESLGTPQAISREESERGRLNKTSDFYGRYMSPSAFYNIKDKMVRSVHNQEIKNYIFLLSREEEVSTGNGNYQKDWYDNSIFHFVFGEEKGIMKKISFSREDSQRLHAANIDASVKSEESGGSEFVRELYNCEIEMFGNNLFEPGNTVFVSPVYPGIGARNDLMFKIGLGGYYTVTTVNNSVSLGSYTTNLTCKWQSFGKVDVGESTEISGKLTPQQQSKVQGFAFG